MVIHRLTPAECEELLARASIARLACARANQPYIVPISVNFSPVDRCLYSFATLGQKIDWMRGNTNVCVAADEITDRFNWTSVLVFGRYEEISRNGGETPETRRARELLQNRSSWWLPAAAKLDDGSDHGTAVFFRISIETLTGRRSAR